MKQKDIFLNVEGDAWYRRNTSALGIRRLPESDPVLVEILNLPSGAEPAKILEIGCGDGTRLNWLRENRGDICHGLDPSAQAVAAARDRGLEVQQGTAESLPFGDKTFDMVIFGFCLYLCDRDDLFRIASEADRVLKSPGWLLILDFYSPTPLKREYHHRAGLFSYKMDYRTLFTWNPAYVNFSHHVLHHSENTVTDNRSEWMATSVLRKNLEGDV